MSNTRKIQLQTASILRVPIHNYDQFTFIVNGERFITTGLKAELLSNKICQIHQIDPTINEYTINTQHRGQFSTFLNFTNFQENEIPENELPFIIEIISELGNESYNINVANEQTTITNDNIFTNLYEYKKYEKILNTKGRLIDYISSHFYELVEEQKEEMEKLNYEELEEIIRNQQLQIKDEDQLLQFINSIYQTDRQNSELYQYVIFQNVGQESLKEFVEIFDINDINNSIWHSISERLIEEIKTKENEINNYGNRYTNKKKYKGKEESTNKKGIRFEYNPNNQLNGIINYLRNKSNNNIENEINITSTKARNDSDIAKNVTIFEDSSKFFYSIGEKNAFLCFDFKEHKIIPTNYVIRSDGSSYHPKNWVIEGSNDKNSWEIIDQQNEFPGLKASQQTCEFTISNDKTKSFRYIQLRQTGQTWNSRDFLVIGSIEFYGTLL